MSLRDRPTDDGVEGTGVTPRGAHSRFAQAVPGPSAPDQIDVVLGEWARERPQTDLAPVAITARVSRLAQILQ